MKKNAKNQSEIILGIDPGYDRVGWAIAENKGSKFNLISLGCIQTNKKETIFQRYKQIIQEIELIIEKYSPNTAAVETLFFSKNKKTALRVSEARGILIASLLRKSITVHEYTPVAIKIAVTGSGAANKTAVEKMVKMQVNRTLANQIDDAIDAVAIAMTHAFTHSY